MAQGTAAEGVAQGTAAEGVAQGTATEGVAQGTAAEGVAQGTATEGVAQGTATEGLAMVLEILIFLWRQSCVTCTHSMLPSLVELCTVMPPWHVAVRCCTLHNCRCKLAFLHHSHARFQVNVNATATEAPRNLTQAEILAATIVGPYDGLLSLANQG